MREFTEFARISFYKISENPPDPRISASYFLISKQLLSFPMMTFRQFLDVEFGDFRQR